MAPQNTTAEPLAPGEPETSSTGKATERIAADLSLTADYPSIFSAPALEIVFQWWQESNRRWAERADASRAAARL